MAVTDVKRWAASQAAELRMAQGVLDRETPAGRRDYLVMQIRQALQTVPTSEKQEHLRALSLYFPDFGETRTVVEKVTVVKEADLEEATPEALLETFIKKAQRLPAERKQEFARQLAEAGISLPKPAAPQPPAPAPAPVAEKPAAQFARPVSTRKVAVPAEARDRIQADEVNAERAVILLGELLTTFERANSVLWHFVQDPGSLNLRSRIQRTHGSIEASGSNFLRREGGGEEELRQMCEAESKIGAVIVETVNDFLLKFLGDIATKFEPGTIEAKAKQVRFGRHEEIWRTYRQTFDDDLGHMGSLKQEALKTWAHAAQKMWKGQ